MSVATALTPAVHAMANEEGPDEGGASERREALREHGDARVVEIGVLQQRARVLEDEIVRREGLEVALREALLSRDRLLRKAERDRTRMAESEERGRVQRRRLELLQSITASFARARKPLDIAAILLNEATAAVGAPRGSLWLVDREDAKTLERVRSWGPSDEKSEVGDDAGELDGEAPAERARLDVGSRTPIAHCHSLRTEVCLESRAAYVEAYRATSLRSDELSLLCLPLAIDDRSFGAFSVAFAEVRQFTADERAFLVTLAHHAAQALDRARLFEDGERVAASFRFLSEASSVLAGSLDYDATLEAVTRLAVPRIADWAAIDMLSPDGTFRRMGVAHIDRRKVELAHEFSRLSPIMTTDATGPGRVVRTGLPETCAEITDGLLAAAISDPEALRIIRSLGIVSSMCVPLHVGGRPAGAVTLVSAESRRRFGASDVALAEELARRASMAIDNARAYREAKEANRVKDDFLATMSHELRTPLNAILGWSALLLGRADIDVRKAVETIERNARAQVRLIEEVLDISRIMTGKLLLDAKAVDLATVLRGSVDVVAPAAAAKGIAIDTAIELDPCPFYGDADRLQQVFWNLLSNAVKFTPKGGRVALGLACVGPELVVTVKDTGRGIRSDFLPVMFQRFRQADSSTTRTEGGLGIGLAIVGHLVDRHGGVVTAESKGEGQGATFTVRLPVRTVSVEESGDAVAAASDTKLLTGLRVLVCEDDADSRDLLREVLSSEGATVRIAAAAAEALDELRQFLPDVLVSDIGLPLIDGYALIRQIRQLGDDQGGKTPAIALTAYASSEDARRAFSAGYQFHVTKPVDPQDLTTRVARLAGRTARASDGTR